MGFGIALYSVPIGFLKLIGPTFNAPESETGSADVETDSRLRHLGTRMHLQLFALACVSDFVFIRDTVFPTSVQIESLSSISPPFLYFMKQLV